MAGGTGIRRRPRWNGCGAPGALAITRRDGFRKVYDLTERVIPAAHRGPVPEHAETVDWACGSALDRLGFATPRRDRGLLERGDAREAAKAGAGRRWRGARWIEVEVEGADGSVAAALARPGRAGRWPRLPPNRRGGCASCRPSTRRCATGRGPNGCSASATGSRSSCPKPKRRYGYYVFPVLEGARLIGRIDVKALRDADVLRVRAFWPEAGVKLGAGRLARLEAELDRLARFAGCGAGGVRRRLAARDAGGRRPEAARTPEDFARRNRGSAGVWPAVDHRPWPLPPFRRSGTGSRSSAIDRPGLGQRLPVDDAFPEVAAEQQEGDAASSGRVWIRVRLSNISSSVPKPPGKMQTARARIRKCILRMAK